MIRASLALLALSAAPVAAQEVTFEETPEGIIAHYTNDITMWNTISEQTYRFEAEAGTVVMMLHRTQNSSCEPQPCADWLEIIETPPGYVAVPSQVELPELATTTVKIILFLGG